MSKFLSVLLAAMLLTIAVLPASADPPEPGYYSVVQKGPCWLPSGDLKPTNALGVKQVFHWTAPLRLVAICQGQLPKDAPRPKETIKVTYESSGAVCEVSVGGTPLRTIDYGATVHPNGTTEIVCRVDLD